jgi:HD-GYP domain-containing protein (c-di-GMP phosphodiesterase class II)
MLAERLGFSSEVQQSVRYTWEQWNGKGMGYGLRGSDIPLTARVLHISQALEVAHRFGGQKAAIAMAKERSGKDFDPDLSGAFDMLADKREFWSVLEHETVQKTILDMRPPSPYDTVSDDNVQDVCEVLADFTDIKCPRTRHHSRTVAAIATGIARCLHLPEKDSTRIGRAALIHDLGKVTVPDSILDKKGELSESEWERFRLHPYYSERILLRVEKLKELAPAAASHHEAMDGRGYYRQLRGDQISVEGRILAVADTYALISGESNAASPEEILAKMRPLLGSQLDPGCYEALVASLTGGPSLERHVKRVRGLDLTDRETEVLRYLAKGLSNRQIAETLVISAKTVETHLDHIYGKLGVTCRTSAVVYAVHNGLA